MHAQASGRSFRVVVLISGRGSNLEALLNAQEGFTVTGVISDRATAGGLAKAESYGIPTIVVPRNASKESTAEFNLRLADAVQAITPDLVVLAGFMHILSAEFISRFPDRIINIHPSLLPQF